MSKKSKVKYNPSSSISLNGTNKAGTNVTPSGTYSYYNMSEPEKEAYEYAQKEFAKNLPQINVFSEDVQKQMDEAVDSFIKLGTQDINEIYEPILLDLQNDIASRFGNLDNSVFLDNLKSIENARGDVISDLALEAESMRQDLVSNELSNRYDFLDFLNSYQQQTNENILNALGVANSLSNTSKNYYESLNSSKNYSDVLDDLISTATSYALGRFSSK